jgi:hypothetical protein
MKTVPDSLAERYFGSRWRVTRATGSFYTTASGR